MRRLVALVDNPNFGRWVRATDHHYTSSLPNRPAARFDANAKVPARQLAPPDPLGYRAPQQFLLQCICKRLNALFI